MLLPIIQDRIKPLFPTLPSDRCPILVAVSGGPDSVVLLRVLHSLQFESQNQTSINQLIVGHVNHQTRGADSIADERFAQTLAAQLNLPFVANRLEPALVDSKKQLQSEGSLRDARYAALIEMAQANGARYIATGHTADDQAETILFRILRGTGIGGLGGIPNLRVVNDSITIVRPLLSVTRREIELLLTELDQPFCVDQSNSESKYSRNFLRHEIIPQLEQRLGFPITPALLRLSQQASETETYLDQQATLLQHSIEQQNPNEVTIPITILQQSPLIIRRQFFKQLWQQQHWPQQSMTFEWWQSLAEAVEASAERSVLNLPGDVRAEIQRKFVKLSRL